MKQLIVSALLIAMAAASAGAGAAQGIVKRAKLSEGNGGSALTLYIESPTGKPLRLIHVQGAGWKYAASWKPLIPTGDAPAANVAGSTTRETEEVAPLKEELLAVFIDGPSGFAYAWIGDKGWKFLGRVSDGAP
ncbi:MAG TPA: hypothetical protein VGK44_04715 [Casimicrobiaceae bacterium]